MYTEPFCVEIDLPVSPAQVTIKSNWLLSHSAAVVLAADELVRTENGENREDEGKEDEDVHHARN